MKSNAHAASRWLGVLVAFVGGAANGAVAYVASAAVTPTVDVTSVVVSIIVLVLLAAVSAWLLQTWWSLLVVPVACFIGWLGVTMVSNAIRISPSVLADVLFYMSAVGVFLMAQLMPLLAGAAIGTALGMRMRHERPAVR